MEIERFVLGPFQTNTFLVTCPTSKTGIIIDPAENSDRVAFEIEKLQIRLKYILLTHGHVDHIGGVAWLKHEYHAEVLLHEADLPVIQTASAYSQSLGLPAPAHFTHDKLVREDDIISTGSIEFRVLHTPGHTPGGVCYVNSDFIFAGDTLFAQSIGRTDLPGGNYDQIISSIKDKLLTLPDHIQVFPGHGPATTIGNEKMFNPFLQ